MPLGVKMKGKIIGILVVIGLVAGLWLTISANRTPTGPVAQGDFDAVVYKSPSCGCCSLYVDYLKDKGLDVKVEERASVEPIKRQYGVPSSLESCHTTIMGDYFIEGHVPFEAVEKLNAEKPDIAGIAVPGMPSGSPGMPGTKAGPIVVYAVNKDGTSEKFMEV